MNEVELKVNCRGCDGTGLYQGMAERDECAVVCPTCKGLGFNIIKHKIFNSIVPRTDIKRVFPYSAGYVHSDKDTMAEEGTMLHFSRFGCTYAEWMNSITPKPMEELFCPYVHDNQGIGNEPFLECKERTIGDSISKCEYFKEKAKCWKRWNNGEAYQYKKDIVYCDECSNPIKGKASKSSTGTHCMECISKAKIAEDKSIDFNMEKERELREEGE